MLNIKKILLLIGCFLFMTSSLAKQSLNTDELKSFVNEGIQYIKQKGADVAYKEFSKTDGKFVKNGKYLFVYDFQGKCLAHGGNPSAFVGKQFNDYKDKFGTPVLQLLSKIAKSGGGFSGYYFPLAKTGKEEFKVVYVKPIDDSALIGSGFFVQ